MERRERKSAMRLLHSPLRLPATGLHLSPAAVSGIEKPCHAGYVRGRLLQGGRSLLAIVRLLVILAVLAIVGYGSMLALSELVEPEQRDYAVTVPPSRFNK